MSSGAPAETPDGWMALIVAVLVGSQLAAFWLGLRLGPRIGIAAQVAAAALPPITALALLGYFVQRQGACPPGYEDTCGEGLLTLFFSGLACAAMNLLISVPVQLALYGRLRRSARQPTSETR